MVAESSVEFLYILSCNKVTNFYIINIVRFWLQWVDARDKFQTAAELIDAEHRMKKTMWGQFWSAHQRFFKYLCISAKVRHCVRLAREAVKNGRVCFNSIHSIH